MYESILYFLFYIINSVGGILYFITQDTFMQFLVLNVEAQIVTTKILRS